MNDVIIFKNFFEVHEYMFANSTTALLLETKEMTGVFGEYLKLGKHRPVPSK
jgi:hypothetical protein